MIFKIYIWFEVKNYKFNLCVFVCLCLFVCVLLAHISVHHIHTRCPWRTEDSIWLQELQLSIVLCHHVNGGNQTQIPRSPEQSVLIITESFLQPIWLSFILFKWFFFFLCTNRQESWKSPYTASLKSQKAKVTVHSYLLTNITSLLSVRRTPSMADTKLTSLGSGKLRLLFYKLFLSFHVGFHTFLNIVLFFLGY